MDIRIVTLYGRRLRLTLTAAVGRALAARREPLLIAMELRFGCLVTKHLEFKPASQGRLAVPVDHRLRISFTARMGNGDCRPEALADPTTGRVLRNVAPYVPSWCRIDYSAGAYCGEFGFERHAV